MNDRELLERAAKAADIGPLDFDYHEREGHGMYFGPRLPMAAGINAACYQYWRPLTDDGDALRLAVKLHMQVSITNHSVRAETLPVHAVRVNDHDELAATRRAIVLAAEKMGKDLSNQ